MAGRAFNHRQGSAPTFSEKAPSLIFKPPLQSNCRYGIQLAPEVNFYRLVLKY